MPHLHAINAIDLMKLPKTAREPPAEVVGLRHWRGFSVAVWRAGHRGRIGQPA